MLHGCHAVDDVLQRPKWEFPRVQGDDQSKQPFCKVYGQVESNGRLSECRPEESQLKTVGALSAICRSQVANRSLSSCSQNLSGVLGASQDRLACHWTASGWTGAVAHEALLHLL